MGDWRRLETKRGRLYAEKAIMSLDGQHAPSVRLSPGFEPDLFAGAEIEDADLL